MFIKTVKKENSHGKLDMYSCDQCNIIYYKRFISNKESKNNFCSGKCRGDACKNGGVLHQKILNTSMKKYGVKHFTQAESVKEKTITTNIKKYGVPTSSMNENVKEKQKKTNLEKYGYISSAQNQEVKNKAKITCLEKYGEISPLQNYEILKKSSETCRKNYGVNWPMESAEVIEKSKINILKKYGVAHISKLSEIKNKVKETNLFKYGVENILNKNSLFRTKIENTMIKKYGVINPFQTGEIRDKINYKEIAKKAHITKKNTGVYKQQSSNLEKQLIKDLIEHFGPNDIEDGKLINNWMIDCYIKSIDLYIQLDGVYWHGLNRNIEIIKNSQSKIDKVIYSTYLRDIEQNKWFKENNFKLFRITDKEYLKNKNSIINLILNYVETYANK